MLTKKRQKREAIPASVTGADSTDFVFLTLYYGSFHFPKEVLLIQPVTVSQSPPLI